MKKEDILKKGSVEVHAKVSGIRQRHVLKVVREKTAWGMVPYLVGEHRIPAAELIRLAEEIQLPIKCAGMTVFPKGKAAQDFVQKEEKKEERKKDPKTVRKKGLSHDKILSEEDEEEKGDVEDEEEESGDSEKAEKEVKPAKAEPSEAPEQSGSETKESAIDDKKDAPLISVEEVAKETEKEIELENAATTMEKTNNQTAEPSNPEAKDNGVKEKKRSTFSEGVLSEGILR